MEFPKLVRCVDNGNGEQASLTMGKVYTAVEKDDYWLYLEHDDSMNPSAGYRAWRFEDVEENVEQSKPIDAHYTSFVYTLTEEDKQAGIVKVDPYFVSNQWQLGAKDNTGILFHCLKNIARFSDKNTKEREIIALFKQVKRLAELEKVNLEGQ